MWSAGRVSGLLLDASDALFRPGLVTLRTGAVRKRLKDHALMAKKRAVWGKQARTLTRHVFCMILIFPGRPFAGFFVASSLKKGC